MKGIRQTALCLIWLLPLAAGAETLEERVSRLMRLMLDQEQKLMHLESEVRRLRGELEVLSHTREQGSQSQRNLYADMDERLRRLETGSASAPSVAAPPSPPAMAGNVTPPPVTPAEAAPAPAAPAAGGEQGAYQQAFNLIQAGHYHQAIRAFQTFLQQYPQGEYADNAQYWLGESYYALRDFRSAQSMFQALIENYPSSGKRAHAHLKLGYTYYELKDKAQARQILEQVRLKYPGTPTARLAEERLRRLQMEGY